MPKVYYEIQKGKLQPEEKQRPSVIKGLLFTLPFLLVLGFYLFRENDAFAAAVIAGFSTPYRTFMGKLCSWVPFSVMEALYILGGLYFVYYVVRSVILIVKGNRRLRILGRRLFVFLVILLYIWSGYCWFWGIDYYGESFSEQSGIVSDGVTMEELVITTLYFAQHARELSGLVERDAEGHFALPKEEYFAESEDLYDNMEEVFPFLEGESNIPKGMIFSKVMSHMGFTGIYFPFTGESNINVDCPAVSQPATIAHELAHQRGVYSEQEANFVGITACILSDDITYQYSGYLCGLTHLMNTLYRTDKEIWKLFRETFTPTMEVDWQDNNKYWESYESEVTEAAGQVYNMYLQSNGQAMGIRSYGACVDLLVAYYKDQICI